MEIEQLGCPPPEGAPLFNVYVGNSSPGLPEISPSFGGYFAYDLAGWPMIVVSIDAVTENVAAHEFFHALQAATSRFDLSEESAWYIEASANWAAMQVYPDNVIPPGSYTFLSYLPLYYYDYPDEGTLEEAHHYGAYLFLHYLSTFVAGPELIRESWLDPGAEEDPLLVLQGILMDWGVPTPINEVFADFAAHNATWDYPEETALRQGVAWLEQQLPGQNRHIVATHGPTDVGSWFEVPSEVRPQNFGYNVVKFEGLVDGDYGLAFEIPASGNSIQAQAFVRIIRKRESERNYQMLPVAGTTATAHLPDVASDEVIFLVVSAQLDGPAGSALTYRYLLDPVPLEDDGGAASDPKTREPTPGGCSTSGSSEGSSLLLFIGLSFALCRSRYRRREVPCSINSLTTRFRSPRMH